MKLDLSKYAQNENGHWVVPTREGGLAIIFTDKSPESYPLAGYYEGGVRQWCHNGFYYGDFRHSDYDLLPPEPETMDIELWLNVYGDRADLITGYDTKDLADACASHDRIACIRITRTITKGEGL